MLRLVFDPIYSQLSLPDRHRFPIDKYQGIRDALAARCVANDDVVTPAPVSEVFLKQHFAPAYVDSIIHGTIDAKAMRRIGFPWSKQLVRRTLTAVGGTLTTARLAMENGLALNLTGGYHHAFAEFGSGFCIFNDVYLAACEMLNYSSVDRVLIIDCDVHQGDGTAKLAADRSDIITLSIHGEKNFPHRKQSSDLDFPLPKGTQDGQYLDTLETALHLAFALYRPDAVIYDAGVDIHANDDLGHLSISTPGVLARDKLVLARCANAGVPVAGVIGGGYQRDIQALVEIHLQLFVAAGVC